jgi:hypothetical protein
LKFASPPFEKFFGLFEDLTELVIAAVIKLEIILEKMD